MGVELRAVLFDLDGVLIDSAAVAYPLLAETAARHGAHLSSEELSALTGASGGQFWSYVVEKYALSGSVREYLESYDVEAEIAGYHPGLIAPGVVDLISRLTAAGVVIGLVTSAESRRARYVLDLAGIADRFAVQVHNESVERHKPDPEPYLAAAESLGLSAEACLAIEDSVPGVRSARRAGMVAIAYTGIAEDPIAAAESQRIVRDFRTESPHSIAAAHGVARRTECR